MTATPDPLDIACAIEYFDEHGIPLNAAAAAIRNLVAQLRYERRLLGAARRVLDGVADSGRLAPSEMEKLRNEAADVARRIVGEIGHPVTDEPALGPDLRAELARVTHDAPACDALCRDIEEDRDRLVAAIVNWRDSHRGEGAHPADRDLIALADTIRDDAH